jgi:SAM-dependent methyltransferase
VAVEGRVAGLVRVVKWAHGDLPGPAGDSWGEEDNARRYDAHAHEYPSYRETSRDLVALALPLAAAAVSDAAGLDLACGTGATIRETLAVLGPGGRVTGVGKSAAMLGPARETLANCRDYSSARPPSSASGAMLRIT